MEPIVNKERMTLDLLVTSNQKDALLTILKVLEIEIEEGHLTEDEEDLALRLAMDEGKKSGIASGAERQEFESWLFKK